ncbi:MAG: hypothetical protein E5V61_27670, partial [Mesorhizobium sp.]
MLVAMPTAMPPEPLTSRFGKRAGRTFGSLPDVRDGLKPVHRRILYASHESGYHWNRKYVKSARPVAD